MELYGRSGWDWIFSGNITLYLFMCFPSYNTFYPFNFIVFLSGRDKVTGDSNGDLQRQQEQRPP